METMVADARHEALERWKHATNPVGWATLDPVGRLVFWDTGCEHLTGLGASAVLGRAWSVSRLDVKSGELW